MTINFDFLPDFLAAVSNMPLPNLVIIVLFAGWALYLFTRRPKKGSK